jgi:hypothetical protein
MSWELYFLESLLIFFNNLIINEAKLDFNALIILFYHHTKHIFINICDFLYCI